eukprot:765499-Heterocapsa_arctica.AAC.1
MGVMVIRIVRCGGGVGCWCGGNLMLSVGFGYPEVVKVLHHGRHAIRGSQRCTQQFKVVVGTP